MSTVENDNSNESIELQFIIGVIHCGISFLLSQSVSGLSFATLNAKQFCYPKITAMFYVIQFITILIQIAVQFGIVFGLQKLFNRLNVKLTIVQHVIHGLFDALTVIFTVYSNNNINTFGTDLAICNEILRNQE
ncbi:Hypothetical_protein [Hexamita inflata]|uniref:Hypothetical_protein n=1 Tax=Hexamita inflata TaxID=28002 RepID=A0AA86PJT9_9EUKA|nr:Hypothetical protein HINF_LOCUS28775 [Hexamita inflata]